MKHGFFAQFAAALGAEAAAFGVGLQTAVAHSSCAQGLTIQCKLVLHGFIRRRCSRRITLRQRLHVTHTVRDTVGAQQRIQYGGDGRTTDEYYNHDFHGAEKLVSPWRARHFREKTQQLAATPRLRNAPAQRMRRIARDNFACVAEPARAQMRLRIEQQGADAFASRSVPAMGAQVSMSERTQQPGPCSTIMVGDIALSWRALEAAQVARVLGRQRTHAERNEQSLLHLLDDAERSPLRHARVLQ
jgi:hypothetical protein